MPSRSEIAALMLDTMEDCLPTDPHAGDMPQVAMEVAARLLSRWPHIAGPDRIGTVEELRALPTGSVILLGPNEPAVKRFHDEWVVACSPIECTTEEIGGAFIGGHTYPILYRPDPNPEEGAR